MKPILFFMAIHFLAYQFARAQDVPASTETVRVAAEVKSAATHQVPAEKVDDCKDLLPQMESDYKEIEAKYKALNEGSKNSQEGYLVSFNEMTRVLFQLTEARVEETQKIVDSRNQLSDALDKFNQGGSEETSKKLQEQYLDLTVRLYSAAMDSQAIVDTLKSQMAQVESTRGNYEHVQAELEILDHQKLALESKLVSLKIKCQPLKKY